MGSNDSSTNDSLSRRERQIMDIVYEVDSATAREVWKKLPDPPTYATVRSLLRVLLEKGHLAHQRKGRAYVYSPVQSREKAAKLNLQQMLKTFFNGSVEQAVSGLLELRDPNLDDDELERIEALIRKHKDTNQKK